MKQKSRRGEQLVSGRIRVGGEATDREWVSARRLAAATVSAEMVDDYPSHACETHAPELDKFIPHFAPPELIAEFTSAMMKTLHATSRHRAKSASSTGFEAAPIQIHNFDVDPSRVCAI